MEIISNKLLYEPIHNNKPPDRHLTPNNTKKQTFDTEEYRDKNTQACKATSTRDARKHGPVSAVVRLKIQSRKHIAQPSLL